MTLVGKELRNSYVVVNIYYILSNNTFQESLDGRRPPFGGRGGEPPFGGPGYGGDQPFGGPGRGHGGDQPFGGRGRGGEPPFGGPGRGRGGEPPFGGPGRGGDQPFGGPGRSGEPPFGGPGRGGEPPFGGPGRGRGGEPAAYGEEEAWQDRPFGRQDDFSREPPGPMGRRPPFNRPGDIVSLNDVLGIQGLSGYRANRKMVAKFFLLYTYK